MTTYISSSTPSGVGGSTALCSTGFAMGIPTGTSAVIQSYTPSGYASGVNLSL